MLRLGLYCLKFSHDCLDTGLASLLRLSTWEHIFQRTRKHDCGNSLLAQVKMRRKWPRKLAEEAVGRMLEYDTRFIEVVEEGRASVRRGDLQALCGRRTVEAGHARPEPAGKSACTHEWPSNKARSVL